MILPSETELKTKSHELHQIIQNHFQNHMKSSEYAKSEILFKTIPNHVNMQNHTKSYSKPYQIMQIITQFSKLYQIMKIILNHTQSFLEHVHQIMKNHTHFKYNAKSYELYLNTQNHVNYAKSHI